MSDVSFITSASTQNLNHTQLRRKPITCHASAMRLYDHARASALQKRYNKRKDWKAPRDSLIYYMVWLCVCIYLDHNYLFQARGHVSLLPCPIACSSMFSEKKNVAPFPSACSPQSSFMNWLCSSVHACKMRMTVRWERRSQSANELEQNAWDTAHLTPAPNTAPAT
jgi:hypothetical protein